MPAPPEVHERKTADSLDQRIDDERKRTVATGWPNSHDLGDEAALKTVSEQRSQRAHPDERAHRHEAATPSRRGDTRARDDDGRRQGELPTSTKRRKSG